MSEYRTENTSMANNYSVSNYTEIDPAIFQAEIYRSLFAMAISLFGIIVNSIICRTIFTNKHLHMPIYIFIFNMAISDIFSLFAAAVTQPLSLIVFRNKQYQLWYEIACKISIYGINVGFVVSTVTLTVISIERYLTVTNRCNSKSIGWKIKSITAIIWIYAMVLCSPMLHLVYVSKHLIATCDVYYYGYNYNAVYFLMAFFFNYFLPLFIMIIMYIKTALYLRRKISQRVSTSKSFFLNSQQAKKLVKMLYIITIIYMLTTLPYVITISAVALSGTSMSKFLESLDPVTSNLCTVSLILASIASVENPILYMIYNKTLRSGLPKCCRGNHKSSRVLTVTNRTQSNIIDGNAQSIRLVSVQEHHH